MSRSGGRRGGRQARVGELLREVLAEELARMRVKDDDLDLLTITAVEADPDFRQATVLLSSLPPGAMEALERNRPRLQAAVARQARLRWTPHLRFAEDRGVRQGSRVEEILRGLTPGGDAGLSGEDGGRGPAGTGGEEDDG